MSTNFWNAWLIGTALHTIVPRVLMVGRAVTPDVIVGAITASRITPGATGREMG
jgi:hypothetical protein